MKDAGMIMERRAADQVGGAGSFGVPRPKRGAKVAAGIWGVVQWAFQRELASLDFDEVGRETGARRGFGIEAVLIERARLGCNVDGGGRSDPHPDADIVASALAALPITVGGRAMAVQIADLARAGRVPDWMPNPRPRCQPVEWKHGKHGAFAAREFWTGPGRWPAHLLGRDHGYACRVKFSDTAREVASARRGYLLWWSALREVRDNLRIDAPLSSFEITEAMPPMRPWQNKS